MPSLSTYYLLDVTLPAILMVVVAVVAFFLTLISILVKWLGLGNEDHPVPFVFLEMVDLAFPDLEKRKSDGYDLFGRGIKSYMFAILTVMIITVISATCFITFWNVYAVEEAVGGACVDNFDCFPITVDGEYLQEEPVDNCTPLSFLTSDLVFENGSNVTQSLPLELDVTYNCYRLVFRYAEGFGAAGGLLAFTALISKIYFSILVSIRRSTDNNPCNSVWRFVWYGVVWSACGIVITCFLSINLGVSVIRETILSTVTGQIQFTMYTITLVLITVTGMCIAGGIEYDEGSKPTCCNCKNCKCK